MSKPDFVYVTYIASTPEKVFAALTDPELTRRYWWRHRNASDWQVGSSWRHEDYENPSKVDIVGKVLENAPPRRLVITWADPSDADDESRHSRVTFEVEPYADIVRLTVTHEGLEPDSPMLKGITKGWPAVLSSLKTLLETGRVISGIAEGRESPPE